MAEKQRFEFDKHQAYKLLAVTDKEGVNKTNSRSLYANAEGLIAINLRYDEESNYDGFQRMFLDFVQDQKGNWVNRSIHTSPVSEVKLTNVGIDIHTHNSVYVMEKTELKDTLICSNKNTIELYLSMDDNYHFGKGFYCDNNGKTYELTPYIHIGTFTDTVLIGIQEARKCMCRYYFQSDSIEFYNTIYHQQDYSKSMLIHNTSKNKPLLICFEGYDRQWTIAPGESKRIIPFNPIGADF